MSLTRHSSVDRHPAATFRLVSASERITRVRAWYACYTHSRSEKKVETLLRQRGIESFLPVVARERQWHDRRKVVPFPLFPSYVFARFDPTDMIPVLSTPGLSAVVKFDGRLAQIPDADIDNIARFARALSDHRLEVPPTVQYHKGQTVRITSGPFSGIQGIVTEVRGRRRVLVGLRTIGLGFEVDVACDSLKQHHLDD